MTERDKSTLPIRRVLRPAHHRKMHCSLCSQSQSQSLSLCLSVCLAVSMFYSAIPSVYLTFIYSYCHQQNERLQLAYIMRSRLYNSMFQSVRAHKLMQYRERKSAAREGERWKCIIKCRVHCLVVWWSLFCYMYSRAIWPCYHGN